MVDSAISSETHLDQHPTLKSNLAYLSESKIIKIKQALQFAANAHQGQLRLSGASYITHPIEVANILSELKMDHKCIMAGLLHDVIEDTTRDYDDIEQTFDTEIADMVDGLTKIERMPAKSKKENQAENFLKMIMAMCQDIRILMIKLADRLHNMRTLKYMTLGHQKRISKETLDIYAPLARRLGLNEIAAELEEIGFHTLYPLRYRTVKRAIQRVESKHRVTLEQITERIEKALNSHDIPYEYVRSRKKHLYSIYQKMKRKKLSFDEISDMYAIRACVKKTADCYTVLGVIHSLYKPMPQKFKDYIAIPKSNGYRSLHTILFGPSGGVIEAQVRSSEMDHFANMGIAAHNLYKSSEQKLTAPHRQAQQWLNKIMVMQKKISNSLEFIEHLKIDLCPDKVYVFTPEGDIIELPAGATILDFAYAIHTSVGDHCVLAKINQQICPLSTVLHHGETVSVVTKPDSSPDQSWLQFVVTNKARQAIRHHFREQRREDLIQLGWRIANKACVACGLELGKIAPTTLDHVAAHLHQPSYSELLENIALGKASAVEFSALLKVEPTAQVETAISLKPSEQNVSPLVLTGHENLAINYATCCCPIPGDAITGVLIAGEGVHVHRRTCKYHKSIESSQSYHPIEVEWGDAIRQTFTAKLDLYTLNQKGTLAEIAIAVAKDNGDIADVKITTKDENTACMLLTLVIDDRNQLSRIVRRLRRERSILHIKRIAKENEERKVV
jgi:guanosine-3',5'-bis(diphosphate) 3'-pyrophosphohydrolase